MNSVPTEDEHAHYDVAIVGCGPTGATLANLLCQSGINVLIIDREQEIYNLPRAVHFDDETMRVFQTVGIADELEKCTRVNPGMRFVDEKGSVLLDWPRPAGVGRHGWHTSYRIHQPDLEVLLREQLAKHENCQVNLGCELEQIEPLNAMVQLRCRQSGKELSCTAKYVVGCDGANSFVRNTINSDMEDLGFKERWLVVDVLLNEAMPQLGDHTVQFCSPTQAMTYCRNPGLRRRWEMALPDSISDEHAMDGDRIWSLLSRWITPDQAQLERKAIYTFRSELAVQWQRERVFIAGDAAHLTPPFMGQGMCAGIRDAANLAWKLAMVVKGEAGDALLVTYEHERRPHVREYIETAMQLGGLINSLDQQTVESIASGEGPSSVRMASIAPRLGASNLTEQGTGAASLSGTLFSQAVLASGLRLDDAIGYQPMLITRVSENVVQVKSKDEKEVSLTDGDHRVLVEMLEDLGVSFVLVRPDRYIFTASTDKYRFENVSLDDWVR